LLPFRPVPRTRTSHRRESPIDYAVWKILHQGIGHDERGPAVSEEAKKVRARKMIRELRSLGYHVERLSAPSGSPA
jgi:hypothetical protein